MTTTHSVKPQKPQPRADNSRKVKRPYQPPTLRRFGTVAELTQASSGPCAIDGTQGFCLMQNMAMDG